MPETGTSDSRPERRIPKRAEFRFWTEEKLRNADTDQFGHVNHAVLATFFEAGRMELFRARPPEPGMADVEIMVVRLSMSFHREAHYPGNIAIGACVKRVGNASFDVVQGLFDREGCIASAEATCVLIDHQSRRPVRASDTLRQYLTTPST